MKAIMVMFDSLNRHLLPPYGCRWTRMPNFARLAGRTVAFDKSYAGSVPTMPTRRELHTGRHNFLHRSWGPLEPFDDSMPQILRDNGVYSHLISDGYHYWEDGGATYHNRYSSWEISRGQEGDLWKGEVADPAEPEHLGICRRHDEVNRKYMDSTDKQSQVVTFDLGCEFIRTNAAEDNWFLQIETFDPHQPFFTHQEFKDLYPHDWAGPRFDWPRGDIKALPPEQTQHVRYEYAALLSLCDAQLGRVLDLMDEHALWDDTLLIVNTDHGFLLGERDIWGWGKCVQPFFEEVIHTPLFIWDPRSRQQDVRRRALVQAIDWAPTLLDYFGLAIPPDMQGVPLRETIATDAPVREAALFGMHGAHVNCTDGRYVYMRAPVNPDGSPIFQYTLMPTHMRRRFPVEDLQTTEIAGPFAFTKGCKLMKIHSSGVRAANEHGTMLFDLETDPHQKQPLGDPEVEQMMIEHMVRLIKWNDAPPEQFERLGLTDVL